MSDTPFPPPYPLSTTIASLKDGATTSVLVVGSGYGGAIAAYRMAMAQMQVWVFERGKEILPRAWGGQDASAGYPDTLAMVQDALQVDTDAQHFGHPTGLYDLRVGEDVSVLVGCGLGGTSLINANVALEADRRVFAQDSWPAVFQRDPTILDQYYGLATTNLGATPYPSQQKIGSIEYPELNKVAALEHAAREVGLDFSRPPINVTFADGAKFANVQPKPCVLCGDCVTGCNYGSKNTTLMNYLPAAKAAGAQLFNQVIVTRLTPRPLGGWVVDVEDLSNERTPSSFTIAAKIVVLAAGTLGSTEILLRSRNAGLKMSNRIGSRFSCNGDAVAVGYDTDWNDGAVQALTSLIGGKRKPIYGVGAGSRLAPTLQSTIAHNPALRPGPCIAGRIEVRDPAALDGSLTIEEGVLPGAFAAVAPPLAFLGDALEANFFEYADTRLRLEDAQELGTAVRDDTANIADYAYRGPVSRSQGYLVMSHDDANGTLSLENDKIRAQWPHAGAERNFRRDDRILREVNGALRGNFLPDPLWSDALGRQLITVHPLGGCPMGDDATAGVVNDKGQVFNGGIGTTVYSNLYVCDGSIVPSSLGVNPLLTISALAERIAAMLVQEHGEPAEASAAAEKDATASLPRPATAAATDSVRPITAGAGLPSPMTLTAGELVDVLILLLRTALASAAAADAEQAIATLEAACGPVDPTIRPTLLTEMTKDAGVQILAEVTASILNPLAACAVAWMSNMNDAELAQAFGAQCAKLVARFPDAFSPSLSFSERMSGYVSDQALLHDGRESVANPFAVASKYGEAQGAAAAMVADLTISTNDLHAFATDPAHSASVTGTISLGATSVPVTGTLVLLVVDPNAVETWQMAYHLTGGTLTVDGVKILHREQKSTPWADLTTLYVTVTETGKSVRHGILRLGLQDVIAQAFSFSKGLTPSALVQQLKGYMPSDAVEMLNLYFIGEFAGFFAGVVFRSYGGLLADLENFPAEDNKVRAHRPLKALPLGQVPEQYPLRTAGETNVLLTRYNPGGKSPQPVILAPGFMTSAASFAADTIDINIVEYLTARGFDVWLFDYSGSPAVTPERSFTIDDIATYDWPAAVEFVCEVAQVPKVQVLAHCVGSLSFLMALLRPEAAVAPAAGGVPFIKRFNSAICSQLTLHPVTDWLNYLKIDLDVLGLLENVAGIRQLDLHSTRTLESKILDTWLWNVPVPPGEECNNPLCHRVFSVFGPSYAHAQLGADTHNALCEWFGTVYADPFKQLTEILRKGHVVDRYGKDTYLPHVANLGDIPLMFIAGELNQIFTPETSAITLEWLREKNTASFDRGLYTRYVFPDYAHMDHFIGKNAAVDVFFTLFTMLAKYASLPPAAGDAALVQA